MKMGKRMAALALALALTVSCACALAENGSSAPAARSKKVAKLLEVPDFKFFEKEKGIGNGVAPVYTAPDENSLRLADGKASCNVGKEIAVAGYVNGWLLVRYEIGKESDKNRKVRVGYIPPSYSKKYKTGRGDMNFVSISVKLAEQIEITDNPRKNSTPYEILPAKTKIKILAKYTYTGNWWYVEAKLNGVLTRGFINRSKAAIIVDGETYHGNGELGYPAVSPENSGQTGTVTVNGKEKDAMIVRKRADTDSPMVARVYGKESFPCYGLQTLKNGKEWYYIWVDGVWGWLSGGVSTFKPAK